MTVRPSAPRTMNPRRSRRRRGPAGPLAALARGLVVLALLAGIALVALRAQSGVPLRDYKTMHVTVPAVGNLRAHDQVRIAGARVGQVRGVKIAASGHARVELQLEPDAPALPSDTRVAVRAAGLLGARYIELVPGESNDALAEGSTIRGGKDALTFGVPEMLDTFDAETRGGLRSMLGEFGTGMLGRGEQLNHAIHVASGAQRPFQALAEEILARPGAARRFFPSLDQWATAMAASGEDLSRMFSPMATGLQPFVDRRQSTQAMLDEAPSSLSAANTGLTRGRRLLSATRILAVATNETLPSAPSGLRATTALLRTSHGPLRRTASLLRATRPAVPATLRITSALSPVLNPLRRGFDDLTPMVAQIGRYGCDIRNLGVVFRSMTGATSAPGGEVGPLGQLRFQLIVPPQETAGNEDSSVIRDGYAPPCKYLGGSYPSVDPGGAGR